MSHRLSSLCLDRLKLARKKKKSKSKHDNERDRERTRVKELLFKEDEDSTTTPTGSNGRNSPAVSSSSDRKTDAERRFEEVQKQRVCSANSNLATIRLT